MDRKKVLLLNPPGKRLYVRDYYCSKVPKGNHLYEPTDLLFQSGILGRRHEVRVIDAMPFRMGPRECGAAAAKWGPDAVVFVTGSISWNEDKEFLRGLKRRLGDVKMLGSGDILLEGGAERLRGAEFIDAIILDFTTDDTLHYIDGEYEKIENMIYRRDGEIVDGSTERARGVEYEIPAPRHELFPYRKYHFPFVRHHPFATMLTDYGCPFRCKFCVMAFLGYKWRSVENVLEEMERVRGLGIRDINFIDQTFGANKARTMKLLEEMIGRKYGFDFVCWTRADVATEELLGLMKRAGCHTVMMGVESSNDMVLKDWRKGTSVGKLREGFERAKRLGLRTVATYIIGLPGETKEDCANTIRLSLELDTDFASFNIPIPRMSTGLRQDAIDERWISKDVDVMDQSGTFATMGTGGLSKEDIFEMRGRAYRAFYGRFSYVLKRLMGVRSFYELRNLIYMGVEVLFGR